MVIQSARYNEYGLIGVTMDDSMEIWIQDDMANANRQALEEWTKSKGNMIQPYIAPPEAKTE